MNYLAHLALSGTSPDMQVGGFLGDWLKGPLDHHREHWPEAVLDGVALHRHIDVWVDQQPETHAAIKLLGNKYRRIAGPVIDIAFDHYLAKHFQIFHHQHLAHFCQRAFMHLNLQRTNMPAGAQVFLQRAHHHALFEAYAEREVYLDVVASLRKRISKPILLDGIEEQLEAEYAALEEMFRYFYPKLQHHLQQDCAIEPI